VHADQLALTPKARLAGRGELVAHVVQSLARTYDDVDGVRVQFFELQTSESRRLVTKRTFKAGERPASRGLREEDARGKAAIEWLLSDPEEPEFVRDVRKEKPEEWHGTGTGYNTYISAAVVSTSGFHGMLSIDAPMVGSLTPEDTTYVAAAANTLSAVCSGQHAKS